MSLKQGAAGRAARKLAYVYKMRARLATDDAYAIDHVKRALADRRYHGHAELLKTCAIRSAARLRAVIGLLVAAGAVEVKVKTRVQDRTARRGRAYPRKHPDGPPYGAKYRLVGPLAPRRAQTAERGRAKYRRTYDARRALDGTPDAVEAFILAWLADGAAHPVRELLTPHVSKRDRRLGRTLDQMVAAGELVLTTRLRAIKGQDCYAVDKCYQLPGPGGPGADAVPPGDR